MSGFQWVRTDEELGSLLEKWKNLPFVAIDTEFERRNTYFAKPGLIQLADGETVYLIDPLELEELEPLGELWNNTETAIVMHSMSEDVDLLRNLTGQAPRAVFDTQIAASFLGLGDSVGYQNLVSEVLQVELDKSETRSDWLQRPLSEAQISYAVKDAEYLCHLYRELKERLSEMNLLDACREETLFQVQQIMESWDHPDEAYLKLRGAWELPPEKQFMLKELVKWRDAKAQERNKPRPWIFNDAMLIKMAERPARKKIELNRIRGISHKCVHKYGDEVMLVIESCQARLEEGSAALESLELIDAPVKGKDLELYRGLRKVVARVSEESGLSAQLLGSRRQLEQVVISVKRKGARCLPDVFQGWRRAYLASGFKQVLSEKGLEID